MRLAISNIAWDRNEDETIAKLLQEYNVDAIDIAPGKYFPELAKVTKDDMESVRKWWSERGIEITGMQALLFGTTGLNVFGTPDTQNSMLQHLEDVARIGEGLGATRLAFGSPKNRDRSGLSNQETLDIAIPFFQRLGSIANNYGVVFCLEPNPPCYGANFMTTSAETADVVRLINHPCIKMQLDTGAIATNSEDPNVVLHDCSSLIGHIHASEPNLLPLGDGGTDHAKIMGALKQYRENDVITIEMLATKAELHEISIERALTVAIRYYRNNDLGVML
jgi:sugar phosphate isomerase/epimerase